MSRDSHHYSAAFSDERFSRTLVVEDHDLTWRVLVPLWIALISGVTAIGLAISAVVAWDSFIASRLFPGAVLVMSIAIIAVKVAAKYEPDPTRTVYQMHDQVPTRIWDEITIAYGPEVASAQNRRHQWRKWDRKWDVGNIRNELPSASRLSAPVRMRTGIWEHVDLRR